MCLRGLASHVGVRQSPSSHTANAATLIGYTVTGKELHMHIHNEIGKVFGIMRPQMGPLDADLGFFATLLGFQEEQQRKKPTRLLWKEC